MFSSLLLCAITTFCFLPVASTLKFGDACSKPTVVREGNECAQPEFPYDSFCLSVEGQNRCLRANDQFLGQCSIANLTGCVKNGIGRGNYDYECSQGKCASTQGFGKICNNDSDCPPSQELIANVPRRCPNGECFTCVETGGEKRCRGKGFEGDFCSGDGAGTTYFNYVVCQDGLVCDMNVEGSSPSQGEGICVKGSQPLGKVGDNCWQNGVRCPEEQGIYCLFNPNIAFIKSCTKLAKLGERCGTGQEIPPDQHAVCNLPEDVRTPATPFVCENSMCSEPPVEPGAPCSVELGYDCDEGCGGENVMFCEEVNGMEFFQGKANRCVSYEIPVGGSCKVGGTSFQARQCVKGAVCNLDDVNPLAFRVRFNTFSGVCKAA